MATTIIVKPNQSMLDVIVQATGSLEGGMQFCTDNNVAISDLPAVGATYVVSDAALAAGDAGNLTYLQQNNIEIGTLGTRPPNLGFTEILKPVMKVIMNNIVWPAGHYDLTIEADAGFIAVHGLGSAYPLGLDVASAALDVFIAGGAAINTTPYGSTVMTLEALSYKIPWVTGHDRMLVWSNLSVITFEDTKGNRAFCSPLLSLKPNANTLSAYMLPTLLIELVSSTADYVILRLTKSHAIIIDSEFAVDAVNFIGNPFLASISLGADPADPTNTDKMFVKCIPGLYSFGVVASYTDVTSGNALTDSGYNEVVMVG